MNSTYHLGQRIMAYILFTSLLLQSCNSPSFMIGPNKQGPIERSQPEASIIPLMEESYELTQDTANLEQAVAVVLIEEELQKESEHLAESTNPKVLEPASNNLSEDMQVVRKEQSFHPEVRFRPFQGVRSNRPQPSGSQTNPAPGHLITNPIKGKGEAGSLQAQKLLSKRQSIPSNRRKFYHLSLSLQETSQKENQLALGELPTIDSTLINISLDWVSHEGHTLHQLYLDKGLIRAIVYDKASPQIRYNLPVSIFPGISLSELATYPKRKLSPYIHINLAKSPSERVVILSQGGLQGGGKLGSKIFQLNKKEIGVHPSNSRMLPITQASYKLTTGYSKPVKVGVEHSFLYSTRTNHWSISVLVDANQVKRLTPKNIFNSLPFQLGKRVSNLPQTLWPHLQVRNFYTADDEFTRLQKAAEQGDTNAQSELGRRYENGLGLKQDYKQAIEWHEKAAQNLGKGYSSLDQYQQQRKLYEKVLEIKKKYYPADHPEIGITLDNLGNVYGDLGNYEKCKELLEKALSITMAHYGEDHPSTGQTLNNLGNAYGDLGNYEKQKELLEKALAIDLKHYGEDHQETGMTLNNLGNAYFSLGNYEKCKELLEKALAIMIRYYGEGHRETGIALSNLGNVYGSLGNYEKKKELLEKDLAIKIKHYGEDHPSTGMTLANLGNAYENLQNKEEALACYQQAYGIFVNHNHPHAARVKAWVDKLASTDMAFARNF
jgi:tetratricopeptide (TPR) repeat protein